MDDALGTSLLLGFGVAGALSGSPDAHRLLARNEALGIDASLEVLTPADSLVEGVAERIFTVVSQVGTVTHRNLCGPLLAGRLEDGRFFVMSEYPSEATLFRELQELGPEPVLLPRALEVLTQLSGALDAAHLSGLYHRDLCPERIAFGPDKPEGVVVQLRDLGRVALLEAAGLCSSGDATVVSPAYGSPEQLDGGVGSGPSDVYSLGVLAFRLCTGRLPFECASPELYRSAHLESKPHRPRERRPGYVSPLPKEVDQLILGCLEKSPGDRPLPTEITNTLARAARHATRQARQEQLTAGPMGPWKRLRAKAVEVARYVQYVQLGDDSLADALKALAPHDKTQQEREQAVVDVAVHWDAVHAAGRESEHSLRRAALELSLELGRLGTGGGAAPPAAQDLTHQLDELLHSVAAARNSATTALQAATTELTRARQASDDWSRQEANRVSELIAAVRARRGAAGDPSLHDRIDALEALVKETDGGSVRTLPGH